LVKGEEGKLNWERGSIEFHAAQGHLKSARSQTPVQPSIRFSAKRDRTLSHDRTWWLARGTTIRWRGVHGGNVDYGSSIFMGEISARLDEGYAGELIKERSTAMPGSSQPLREPRALYYSNNSPPEVQLYFSDNDPVVLYTFAFLH